MSGEQVDQLPLTRKSHLLALSSPPRLEVMDALDDHGPLTARGLAAHLGKSVPSVYYHLERLVAEGLVVEVGLEETTRRDSVLYAPKARRMPLPSSHRLKSIRELVHRVIANFLRATERDHRDHTRHPERVPPEHRERTPVNRRTAWLTPDEARQVRDHLDALQRLTRGTRRTEGAWLYSITYAMVPLQVRDRSTP